MKEVKFTELVAEFAKENGSCDFDEMRKFIKFFTTHYCFVKKSKVINEHKKAKQKDWIVRPYLRGRFRVLQDLFPELFNPTEQ